MCWCIDCYLSIISTVTIGWVDSSCASVSQPLICWFTQDHELSLLWNEILPRTEFRVLEQVSQGSGQGTNSVRVQEVFGKRSQAPGVILGDVQWRARSWMLVILVRPFPNFTHFCIPKNLLESLSTLTS